MKRWLHRLTSLGWAFPLETDTTPLRRVIMVSCPALLIAAPASGQGKTTVTAALARHHTRKGRRVTVFKCGPDFLDPQIHAAASGRPCQNLDLGMCGEEDARWRLAKAAEESDLILIEGVMGLYDGKPSAADLAVLFQVPVLALVDAGAMAQTFGAVAHGLATYRPGLPFAGMLANKVGSAYHAELLRESLPDGMGWFGALPPKRDGCLPERHLGLLQASELSDLGDRLDVLADAIGQSGAVDLPAAVDFGDLAALSLPPLLSGRRVAVARDAAYGFIYPANIETLQALGAELCFFSPVAGDSLPPDCHAVWLPGGYPELHAEALSGNHKLWEALRVHAFEQGRPMLAECGGMMSLFESVVDKAGQAHDFAGLLPGRAIMQTRVAALGTQFLDLPEEEGGRVAGHTYHFSSSETSMEPWRWAETQGGKRGEAVYRRQRLTATYMHLYFPSNPRAVAALLSGEEQQSSIEQQQQ